MNVGETTIHQPLFLRDFLEAIYGDDWGMVYCCFNHMTIFGGIHIH